MKLAHERFGRFYWKCARRVLVSKGHVLRRHFLRSNAFYFWVLLAAGVYNGLFGLVNIVFPTLFWSTLDLDPPRYLFLWQCIAMIVGVYGIGYVIAASHPLRHWPITLVGLCGKVFGIAGYLQGVITGTVDAKIGLMILTNDLIWIYPFYRILKSAYQNYIAPPDLQQQDFTLALETHEDRRAQELLARQNNTRCHLVFLRHSGCTFCRETLASISEARSQLSQKNIYLIHMSGAEVETVWREKYKLDFVGFISDPELRLYDAAGLKSGRLQMLFGPRVVLRGIIAGLLKRHGIGALDGDGFRMPGVFALQSAKLTQIYQYANVADIADLVELTRDS